MRDEHDDQPDDESYLLLLPLEPGPDEPWVLAAPFRAHVLHSVEAAGIPWPAFAIETGIPVQAIRSLLFGRQGRPLKRLTPRLAARLLRVQPADLHGLHRTYVCADVTAHRLGALLRGGVDPLRLARWCDYINSFWDEGREPLDTKPATLAEYAAYIAQTRPYIAFGSMLPDDDRARLEAVADGEPDPPDIEARFVAWCERMGIEL